MTRPATRHRLLRATGTALCVVVAGLLAVVLLAPPILGWATGTTTLLVDGGSMSPTYERGDLVVVDTRDTALVVDRVITVRRPDGVLYTHRIVALDPDGAAQTRGDANTVSDLVPVTPHDVVGTVVGHISQPWAGAWRASQTLVGRVCIVLILAGALILARLRLTCRGAAARG